MKPRLTALVFIIMTFLLSSCATLLGPREMEIPLARLQESISTRFPFNNRYLELLDVRVTNPRVTLQPGSDRILTSMDTSIAPPFVNKSWSGNFAVSGRLKFDTARNALVLAEPRVEQFTVSGLDPLYANQISRVGSLLAEQLLKDMPLYTFRPEDFRYAGTTFLPARITSRPGALVVSFVPAR